MFYFSKIELTYNQSFSMYDKIIDVYNSYF